MRDERLLKAGTKNERTLLAAGAREAPSTEAVSATARLLGVAPHSTLLANGMRLLTAARGPSTWYAAAAALAVVSAVAEAPLLAQRFLPTVVSEAPSRASPTFVPPVAPPPPAAVSAFVPDVAPISAAPPSDSHRNPGRAMGSLRAAWGSDAVLGQVTMLDRARALLASGEFVASLRILNDYDRTFRRPLFPEEAALLRIQAILAAGDRAAASALASRFLVEHPQSVHTERVRSLIYASAP